MNIFPFSMTNRADAVCREIIDARGEQAWNIILKKGVPKTDARDVYQDACFDFLKALRKKKKENKVPPAALFFTITRRRIADYWKKNRSLTVPIEEKENGIPASTIHPDGDLHFYQILKKADLEETDFILMELRYMEGLNFREIGEAMDMELSTVQSRIRKHTKRLETILKRQGIPYNPKGRKQ